MHVSCTDPELVRNPIDESGDGAKRAVSVRLRPRCPRCAIIGRVFDHVVRDRRTSVVVWRTPSNGDISRTNESVIYATRRSWNSWRNWRSCSRRSPLPGRVHCAHAEEISSTTRQSRDRRTSDRGSNVDEGRPRTSRIARILNHVVDDCTATIG